MTNTIKRFRNAIENYDRIYSTVRFVRKKIKNEIITVLSFGRDSTSVEYLTEILNDVLSVIMVILSQNFEINCSTTEMEQFEDKSQKEIEELIKEYNSETIKVFTYYSKLMNMLNIEREHIEEALSIGSFEALSHIANSTINVIYNELN